MDFNKVKKELEEKGIEKGEQELDKLKARLGGFNSGEVSTASTHPEKQTESQASPPGHDSTQSESPGRTGATPVMDSGKADIGEPDTPRDKEKIREPRPEEDQVRAADKQGEESRREAAIEQNPANDEDQAENAA